MFYISCLFHSTGDNAYYDDGDEGEPVASGEWEHRKIIGLIWENRRGWRVETKKCGDLTGDSTNYIINPALIRMITESNRNRYVRFRSAVEVE